MNPKTTSFVISKVNGTELNKERRIKAKPKSIENIGGSSELGAKNDKPKLSSSTATTIRKETKPQKPEYKFQDPNGTHFPSLDPPLSKLRSFSHGSPKKSNKTMITSNSNSPAVEELLLDFSIYVDPDEKKIFNDLYASLEYNLSKVPALGNPEGYFVAPLSVNEEERAEEVSNMIASRCWHGCVQELDEICAELKTLFQADGAYISIITETDQIPIANPFQFYGNYIIPRNRSLDAHTILSQGIFFIPDTSDDWRFAKNPFVDKKTKIDKKICFFASIAIKSPSGYAVGTISVFSELPRASITMKQACGLVGFALQVTDLVFEEKGKSKSKISIQTEEKSDFFAGKLYAESDKGILFTEALTVKLKDIIHHHHDDSDHKLATPEMQERKISTRKSKTKMKTKLKSKKSIEFLQKRLNQERFRRLNDEINLEIYLYGGLCFSFMKAICELMCRRLDLDMVCILYVSASALYHIPRARYPFDPTPMVRKEYPVYVNSDPERIHDDEDWLRNPKERNGLLDRIAERAGMIVYRAAFCKMYSVNEICGPNELSPDDCSKIPQRYYWRALVPLGPLGNLESVVEFDEPSFGRNGVIMPLGRVRRICFPVENNNLPDMKESMWLRNVYETEGDTKGPCASVTANIPPDEDRNKEEHEHQLELKLKLKLKPEIAIIPVRYNADAMIMVGMRDKAREQSGNSRSNLNKEGSRPRQSRFTHSELDLCQFFQKALWETFYQDKDSKLPKDWQRVAKPPGRKVDRMK